MKLPLEGVKIVEFGTHVVVPNAGRICADWGAEVIKVESLKGELWRIVGLQYSCPTSDEENPLFAEQNANKKFVAIDLKTPAGMEILFKLIADSDIFMTNVRDKALEKLKLDYESLKELKEDIIYVHATGYGYEGPEAGKPGFDLSTFWAPCGTLPDWVMQGDFPFRPPGGFGDCVTGSNLTMGVLAALYAREKTGKGCHVSTSLLSAGLWSNFIGIIAAQNGMVYPKDRTMPTNPFSWIYKCKDNTWLMLTITNYNTDYDYFCKILGLDEYIGDERYNSLDRVASRANELVAAIDNKIIEKTRDEWCEILEKADVAHSRLIASKDVCNQEQPAANGYFTTVTYPSGNTTAFPNVPIKFREYPVEKFKIPGRVGRDTKEILVKYGYTETDVDELAEKKIVKC